MSFNLPNKISCVNIEQRSNGKKRICLTHGSLVYFSFIIQEVLLEAEFWINSSSRHLRPHHRIFVPACSEYLRGDSSDDPADPRALY